MAIDLCTVKKAEHPFLIESVQIRIWSLEELCFFLSRNICLIDQSVVNERLAGWIGDELDLKALSHRLKDALGRPDGDVSYFIMPIFAQIGYLDPDEQRKVRRQLAEAQVRPEEESSKMKADYLVGCGKLHAAQTRYREILSSGSEGKLRISFLESVWNNLGCAYALEFRFEKAADCFLSGYRLGRSRELLRKYLSALPLYLDEEEYRAKLKETGADPVWAAELHRMNARAAEDVSEGIRTRVNPEEDPALAAENLFAEYRRLAS